MEKREPSYTVGGNVSAATIENSINKIVILLCTNIAYSSISSAKIYTCTYMHIHCYYRDYSIFISQFLWRRSYDTHIAEFMLSWNFHFGKRKQSEQVNQGVFLLFYYIFSFSPKEKN